MSRLAPVFALAIATFAQAQVVPLSASAGVVAQAGAMNAVLPVGNDITAGTHLLAGAATGAAGFDFSPSWNDTAVELVWDVSSTAFSQIATSSGGATRHELWSARPIDGRFVITWTVATTGNGSATFGFDLGDDGVLDATASTILPVTLPAGLTVLRVHTATSASAGVIQGPWGIQIPYQGTAQATLSVRFEPTHCTVSTFAPACSGPTTSARGNLLGGVTVRSVCDPAADLAIAVFGFDQLTTPLPLPPGCSLFTTPFASRWRNIGATGVVEWSTSLPVGFGPVAFATQVLGLDVDNWSATTSEGLWIVCQ